MSVIQDIYEVFVDFFGSQNVDLQEYTEFEETRYKILIFWDTVTVTNEFNNSIDIWNLYAKIHLKSNGSLIYPKPHFIRSCYNDTQWSSKYLHSHVRSRYRVENFFEWEEDPCLGSGPINRTINNLIHNQDFYTDMDYWMLFCVELDKYVHVESISGGPYIRMQRVGANTRNRVVCLDECSKLYSSSLITSSTVSKFISHILHNPSIFKFSYYDKSYKLGLPFVEIIKAMTNEFMNWYYADEGHVKVDQSIKILISKGILRECYIKYDHIIYEPDLTSTLDANVGRSLEFNFKGHPVIMSKKDDVNESNKSLILNPEIIGNVVYKVLTLVNFKYGKDTEEGTNSNGSVQRFV